MSTSWVFPCNFTEIIADFIIESWHNRRQHSWYFQQSETVHSFLKADTTDVNILGIFKKVKLFTLFCLTKWCDKRRHWDTEACVYRDSEKRSFYKFINAKNWNMPLSVPPSVKHTFFSNLTPWLFSNAFCFASSSKTGLEHIWNNVSFSEFAKLRAFRACVLRAQVLYASTYLRVFEFYVATCIYNWHVFVSSYFKLCAYVPSVFTCLHALKN